MEDNPQKTTGFTVTQESLLKNKEAVVDFFGDNRVWYDKLLRGGIKFGKTSLDSQDDFDTDIEGEDKDISPLDVDRLTEGRAVSVVKFFEEYPDAKSAFEEYSKTY